MKLLASRLPYPYGLVYSYLASVPAARRRDIEAALGVNCSRTLPTTLRRLAKLGLVAEPRRGRLEARPPPADLHHLFTWKKTPAGGGW